jgi:hypothetical protein
MGTHVQQRLCVPKIFEDMLDLVRGPWATTPGPHYDVVLAAMRGNAVPGYLNTEYNVGLAALADEPWLVDDAVVFRAALRIYCKFLEARVPPPRVHQEDGLNGAAVWCLGVPNTVLPGGVTLRCTGDFVKHTLDAAPWSPERFEILERYLWVAWQAICVKDPYPWKTIIGHPRCPWRVQMFARMCLAGATPSKVSKDRLKGVLRAAVRAGWHFGFGLGKRHSYREHWIEQPVVGLTTTALMLAAGFPSSILAMDNYYMGSHEEWALAKLCGSTFDDYHARCFQSQRGLVSNAMHAWPIGSENFPLFNDCGYGKDYRYKRFRRMSTARQAWMCVCSPL